MFYPFQKDHRHTTPPSDFHLPRPQLAIIENFECNQVFTFYVFVREYIKKECCQPGHYPYILGGCNPFRALWQRTIDCFSKVTDRAENSALRPPGNITMEASKFVLYWLLFVPKGSVFRQLVHTSCLYLCFQFNKTVCRRIASWM